MGVLVAVGAPAGAEPAPGPCTPGPELGCVGGTLRDAGASPVAGVELAVSGPGGATTVSTDADGRWSVSIPEPGDAGGRVRR